MKTKLVLLSLLMVISSQSCQKIDNNADLIDRQANPKLKRILLYWDTEATEPVSIVEEYEYDSLGRISRTSSPMYDNGKIIGTIKYNIYEYNSAGQLSRIINYNASSSAPDGFINLWNWEFSYSREGNKIKELWVVPHGKVIETHTYDYWDGRLISSKTYDDKNKLITFVENHYNKNGMLIAEYNYGPDETWISNKIHTYSGDLRVKTVINTTSGPYREINMSYDKDNKLILLDSKELTPFSSSLSYVLRYEYY